MTWKINQCRGLLILLLGIAIIIKPAIGAVLEAPVRDVYIVTGDSAPASQQITEALVKRIKNAKVVPDTDASIQKRKNALYIAVGPAALATLINQPSDGAVLALLISSQAYRSSVDGQAKTKGRDISAVYAEASPFTQLKLAASILKHHGSLVTFLSSKTAYLKPILQRAAQQAGVDLEVILLSGEVQLTQELDHSAEARGVLALPDTSIYTPENIRAALITTYRQNQFVIGFSSSFVKAGALASTYSTIDDIANQAVEVSRDFFVNGRLPAPQYPKYFSVTVNDNVARSLNIIITDEIRNFSERPQELSQ